MCATLKLFIFEKKLKVELADDEIKLFNNQSEYLSKQKDSLIVCKSFFAEDKKVKDVSRYILSYAKNKWELLSPSEEHIDAFDNGASDTSISNSDLNIIILLESPHKDEYDSNFTPLSPARGETGKNFFNYFVSHVMPILFNLGMTLDQNKKYKICFVNPVPYQSSLNEIHKKGLNKNLRDKVWLQLFPACEYDFLIRLKNYNPKLIINACTSNLKPSLQNVLKTFSVDKYDSSHPSSWKRALASFKAYNPQLKATTSC